MSKLGIKRATVIVDLCTDMDQVAEWERLVDLLKAERAKPDNGMLAGNPEIRRLAAEITAIERAMDKNTLRFTLAAVTRKVWAEAVAAHPAREDNEQDAERGVNVSTFVDAVMAHSIVSVTHKESGETVDFTGADWHEAADEMSNGQWEEFAAKVFLLNNGVVGRPTSRAASLVMRSSETSSEQPEA